MSAQRLQKALGVGEECASQVDGSVHVQGYMLDLGTAFQQSFFRKRGDIRFNGLQIAFFNGLFVVVNRLTLLITIAWSLPHRHENEDADDGNNDDGFKDMSPPIEVGNVANQ